MLTDIFSFSNEECGVSILNFFSLRKFEKFEEPVRLVKEFFPNCGDII